MVRLLPFILVPILILGGLWYFRFSATKPSQTVSQVTESQTSVEVPKTLPGASLEERVKSLENINSKLVTEINALKAANTQAPSVNVPDLRMGSLESAVTDLKTRLAALEKASPAPASSGKATIYIPLGAGGYWTDIDWHTLSEYEVSMNPDYYPGYTGMNLEVNFRLAESSGTGSVRLYNVTDSSAISGEVSTTSADFTLQSTSSFKLPSGTKIYRLQVKSTERKELHIQSARIKVSF